MCANNMFPIATFGAQVRPQQRALVSDNLSCAQKQTNTKLARSLAINLNLAEAVVLCVCVCVLALRPPKAIINMITGRLAHSLAHSIRIAAKFAVAVAVAVAPESNLRLELNQSNARAQVAHLDLSIARSHCFLCRSS